MQDGISSISKTVEKAAKDGMSAVALTDHGFLSGIPEHWKECRRVGIKPILGVEAYIIPHNGDISTHKVRHHLVLLCKNRTGYTNILKLMSIAGTRKPFGPLKAPILTHDLLSQYSEGLIGLSACMSGEVNESLYDNERRQTNRSVERAKEAATRYLDIFGKGNFYLEVQYHGISRPSNPEAGIITGAFEISKYTGIPIVITNDSHYVEQSHWRLRDIILADRTRQRVDDPCRKLRDAEGTYWFKTSEEMLLVEQDILRLSGVQHPLILNTMEVCNKIEEFDIGLGNSHYLPVFAIEHYSQPLWESILKDGFHKCYPDFDIGSGNTPGARLEREKSIIERMGFRDYFLILWDITCFCKKHGIPMGPGRGSAAGSIVAYCLGITSIDPIRHGLLFERFLNPDRVSLPDIDFDVCKERRGEVIRYLGEKYGADSVAQIATFNRLKGRGIIRTVGKALGIPYEEYDSLSKQLPKEQGEFTQGLRDILYKEIGSDSEFVEVRDALLAYAKLSPSNGEFIKNCISLEGIKKAAGVHAAGVVITPGPTAEYCPLRVSKDNAVVTQYDMNVLEELGLLKLDLLGLDTLSMISDCLRSIRESGHLIKKRDVLTIRDLQEAEGNNLEDPFIYDTVFRDGRTLGVFQCDSPGIRTIIKRLRTNSFNDICASISLFRPGPLDSGISELYIRRHTGKSPAEYWHESLIPCLSSTYGLPIYQEQLMTMSQILCGFTISEADELRKIVGKKKKEQIIEFREKFVNAAESRGIITRALAEDIYDKIVFFGRYSFNFSHAVSYAYLSYYTAWLKAYYPKHFMCAVLNKFVSREVDRGPKKQETKKQNRPKFEEYLKECERLDIKVVSPHISRSSFEFKTDGKVIFYGIGALPSIGKRTRAFIDAKDQFGIESFADFVSAAYRSNVTLREAKELFNVGLLDLDLDRDKVRKLLFGFYKSCNCKNRQKCKRCKGSGIANTLRTVFTEYREAFLKNKGCLSKEQAQALVLECINTPKEAEI
jgi:DNA polymerase III subunit alpha